jgi:hypothetical protein
MSVVSVCNVLAKRVATTRSGVRIRRQQFVGVLARQRWRRRRLLLNEALVLRRRVPMPRTFLMTLFLMSSSRSHTGNVTICIFEVLLY